MSQLPEYLDTIEPYASDGYWTPEEYDEAVHQYLHKQFGELFKRNVERQIYLDHDHHAMLESEMYEELSRAVEQGWMTEEEMECRIIDWVDTHRDI